MFRCNVYGYKDEALDGTIHYAELARFPAEGDLMIIYQDGREDDELRVVVKRVWHVSNGTLEVEVSEFTPGSCEHGC